MVSHELFERYETALGVTADLAARDISQAVESVAHLAPEVAAESLAIAYAAVCERYGAVAAQAALEFYIAQRAASNAPGAFDPMPYAPPKSAFFAQDVAEVLQGSGGDVGKLADALTGRANRRVLETADEPIARNSAMDPARPRWALIPHAGACGWCRLQASLGFSFTKKQRVVRHDNCRCTVACDFGRDPSVEGYDSAQYGDQYSQARQAVEGDAESEWASMSPEERAKYKRGKRTGVYDVYLRNRIVQEMNRKAAE